MFFQREKELIKISDELEGISRKIFLYEKKELVKQL